MIVQTKGHEGEIMYKFYTYDPAGRDVIIPIFAKDEDSAWEKFDQYYGTDTIVDQMIKA